MRKADGSEYPAIVAMYEYLVDKTIKLVDETLPIALRDVGELYVI